MEMNPEELAETALYPSTRCITKVKIDDMKSSEIVYNALMGKDADLRKDFIAANSQYANLDI